MTSKAKIDASKIVKTPQKKPPTRAQFDKAGFKLNSRNKDDEDIKVNYIIDNVFQKVEPYFYNYRTYCKKRWIGKSLLDIFSTEFRDKSKDYYKTSILDGKIKINDKVADLDDKINDGDLILHKSHKHEPPILSKKIEIIYENQDILIINKPNGIPAHPSGRYKFNTVVNVLKYQFNKICHPCNRLDRLTSGLMFLAKTPAGSRIMFDQLFNRALEKSYIAKVKGNFPLFDEGGKKPIMVNQPLETIEPKLGLNGISENGKEAITIFEKISFDPITNTSLVKCKPLTGRSHQIRVHLQYLGHPIANDPIYSNIEVWGEDLNKKNTVNFKEIIEKLDKIGKINPSTSWYYQVNKINIENSGEILTGKTCEVCQTDLYTDPLPEDLEIWLHAYQYNTKNYNLSEKNYMSDDYQKWSFKTPLPDWALDSHKSIMKLAIGEARKCPPTTTAFGVGAILFDSNNGEILSTGYSRELPGNTHAEQNALTKYYEKNSKLPDGTVLYTTMEPCSLRLSGNLPCVDRILQTNGKIITCFVGVFEPKTFVENNVGYKKLTENGVEYIHIPGFEKDILEAAYKGHENK